MQNTRTPKEIVSALDKHIVGQDAAKRAVAVALRNRFRRMQLNETLRKEVTPKNILMIGPTGVGKTEIARRLADIAHAPFIKVEATKFTEVGYVGRDVESIIRDLLDVAVKKERELALDKVAEQAEKDAEEKILDVLLPKPDSSYMTGYDEKNTSSDSTREIMREKLRSGSIDDKEIEIDVAQSNIGVEIMAPPGMEEMTQQLQGMFQNMNTNRSSKRKVRVKEARKLLQDEQASKLVNDDDLKARALDAVEQNGIVFLDEIDKVTQRSNSGGSSGEVSREGVQRDLLPLIEGSTVSTKYGMVKTDHILFIASGAFHLSKPADLIPELQGRLPIRVELDALKPKDFVRILTEPDASLTLQHKELLATEGVDLEFTEDGIDKIAQIAWEVNESHENIGARRLHTVLEKLLEDVSYKATELSGNKVVVDASFVETNLSEITKDQDLSQYIL